MRSRSWPVAFVLTASQSILGGDTISSSDAANPLIRRIGFDTLTGGGDSDRITANDQPGLEMVGCGPGTDTT
jgi:hypothetical protein